jgi:hypothetical protein
MSLSQCDNCWRLCRRSCVAQFGSLLGRTFTTKQAGTVHPTWPTLRPHHEDDRPPDHLSTAHNICHVIRHFDNTHNYSSRHELLFIHAANAIGAPDGIALPTPTSIDSLEWLLRTLGSLKPIPAQPVKYTVQHRLQWLRKIRTPAGSK